VAVVQLSKIQIRRGQRNTGSGLPQLASGELGWAIDTRELYIGNGAVSEGAPAVGNTKVLTEYDDIFSIASTYTYKQDEGYIETGPNSGNPVERTLQQRLDDTVSVKSFGARGDGSGDDTQALQRAIDQLFINNTNKTNPVSRVRLHIEPGVYNITGTLYIPPYATVIGAGSDKTVLKQIGSASVMLQTVNAFSEPGNYFNFADGDEFGDTTSAANQAQRILVEGITLETNGSKGMVLENCVNSEFRDIKIVGGWDISDSIANDNIGIEVTSLSSAVKSSDCVFLDCEISNFSYAVKSDYNTTGNKFDRCEFYQSGHGIVFGQGTILGNPGQEFGPSRNIVSNSYFHDINKHGIWIVEGERNVSENNQFVLVGNSAGNDLTPSVSIIQYDVKTNKSIDDYFSRTERLISGSASSTVPYVPEVGGAADFILMFENEIDFGRQLSAQRIFRLPGVINQSYEIDYMMITESRFVRKGTLTVVVYATDNDIQVYDEYYYAGEENSLQAIEFEGQLRSLGNSSNFNTIDVKATSNLQVNDRTYMTFTIKAHRSDRT